MRSHALAGRSTIVGGSVRPIAGRIVLFGATGYTGDLTARALVERGAKPVLAGRSRDKLKRLASELGGDLDIAAADVSQPESVRALVEEGDVLVSTVGPFTRWGAPAVEAAIAKKAHYIDSTGEGSFIRRVFEHWGPLAEAAGCGLVTAFGYDYVPGNLAGALALEEAGESATKLEAAYFMTGKFDMSGGTRRSAAGAAIDPTFAYRGGRIVTERGARRVKRFNVRGKERQCISVGMTEHFSLPRVYPHVQDVETYLGWFGPMSRALQVNSAVGSVVLRAPGARRGVNALIDRFVKGSTGGPDESERVGTGSYFVAIAKDANGASLAEVHMEGPNGYDYTAGMLAWGAMRTGERGMNGTGALGPVEAFGLEGLEGLEAGNRELGLRRV